MIAKIKAWWLFRCCTDIAWRQSLPSAAWNISDQHRHKTERRTSGETLCPCENQNPAQLIRCRCHSSAASLHNLNSSFCSLCWSSTWLYQTPLLNARREAQNCHHSAPGNTPSNWLGWQWGFAQNPVSAARAVGELEWDEDFCHERIYSRV